MMAEAGEPYTYYANALNMSRITSSMAVPIPFGAYTRWKINSAALFHGAREGKMGTLLAPTTAPLSLCSPGPGALRRFHGPGDCATEIVSITAIQKKGVSVDLGALLEGSVLKRMPRAGSNAGLDASRARDGWDTTGRGHSALNRANSRTEQQEVLQW
ncbi:unnamed protein product [Lepidochelys kempii]